MRTPKKESIDKLIQTIFRKATSTFKAQTKKDHVTEEDLSSKIPNRKIEKIQKSRKQDDREAHIEAEDSCVCSDTISNQEYEIEAEYDEDQ